MGVSKVQSDLLTGVYSGARKSGLLETRPGRWLFLHSYNLYKRYMEDPFHSLVANHPELFRDGHILDIGANIGYTSTLFARAIDPGYNVFAFEPEELNFSYLAQCAARPENRARIVPVRSAVGSEDGTINLWRNEHHHGDHRILSGSLRLTAAPSESVPVPITKIDTFVYEHGPLKQIGFIKVDVQGYELPVCHGMERTLSENPGAVVALEYCPEAVSELGFDPDDLLAWWRSRGYSVSTLERNGTMTRGLSTDLNTSGYVDLLFCVRDPLGTVSGS